MIRVICEIRGCSFSVTNSTVLTWRSPAASELISLAFLGVLRVLAVKELSRINRRISKFELRISKGELDPFVNFVGTKKTLEGDWLVRLHYAYPMIAELE